MRECARVCDSVSERMNVRARMCAWVHACDKDIFKLHSWYDICTFCPIAQRWSKTVTLNMEILYGRMQRIAYTI